MALLPVNFRIAHIPPRQPLSFGPQPLADTHRNQTRSRRSSARVSLTISFKAPMLFLPMNYLAMPDEFGRLSIDDEPCQNDGVNLFRHLDTEAFAALFSRSDDSEDAIVRPHIS